MTKHTQNSQFFTVHELLGRFGVEADYGRTALVRARALYGLGCTRIALVYCGGHLPTLDRIRQSYLPGFNPTVMDTIIRLMKEADDVNCWILNEIDTKYQGSVAVERDCKSILRAIGE